jgi:hypothetical protein
MNMNINTEKLILTCKCGKTYIKARSKDNNLCVDCKKELVKKWKIDNPDKHRIIVRRNTQKWKERHPDAFIITTRRSAAKRRDKIRNGLGTVRHALQSLVGRCKNSRGTRRRIVHVVGITVEYLETLWINQSGLCAISGMAMSHVPGMLTTVSLDRIDSNDHYSPGNVQLVCKWANYAKNASSDGEIKYVIARLRMHVDNNYASAIDI